MRVLVHIPARAGSKGVPGKNLRPVGGVSLIARAARLGLRFLAATGHTGRVLVDTDGQALADEAARAGAPVPFLRSAELATDTATTIDATLAALDRLAAQQETFDAVLLLQPTSPLRALEDVQACFDAHHATGSALTVCTPAHPPQKAFRLTAGDALEPLFSAQEANAPRQQLAPAVEANGAVYVDGVDFLRRQRAFFVPGLTRGVRMPAERSVDLDTLHDFALAEALLAARPKASAGFDAAPPRLLARAAAPGSAQPGALLDEARRAAAQGVTALLTTAPASATAWSAFAALRRDCAGLGVDLLPTLTDDAAAPEDVGACAVHASPAAPRLFASLSARRSPVVLLGGGADRLTLWTALELLGGEARGGVLVTSAHAPTVELIHRSWTVTAALEAPSPGGVDAQWLAAHGVDTLLLAEAGTPLTGLDRLAALAALRPFSA